MRRRPPAPPSLLTALPSSAPARSAPASPPSLPRALKAIHAITAVYSGDSSYGPASSGILSENIVDFSLTPPGDGSVTAAPTSLVPRRYAQVRSGNRNWLDRARQLRMLLSRLASSLAMHTIPVQMRLIQAAIRSARKGRSMCLSALNYLSFGQSCVRPRFRGCDVWLLPTGMYS